VFKNRKIKTKCYITVNCSLCMSLGFLYPVVTVTSGRGHDLGRNEV